MLFAGSPPADPNLHSTMLESRQEMETGHAQIEAGHQKLSADHQQMAAEHAAK